MCSIEEDLDIIRDKHALSDQEKNPGVGKRVAIALTNAKRQFNETRKAFDEAVGTTDVHMEG